MTQPDRTASMMLALAGGVFTIIGLSHLSVPDAMLSAHGLQLTSVSAYSDVRAGYGGLYVALGIVFLAGVARPGMRGLALLMLAAVTSGLAGGRLLSLIVDGAPTWTAFILLAIEAVAAVSVVSLLRRRPQARAVATT